MIPAHHVLLPIPGSVVPQPVADDSQNRPASPEPASAAPAIRSKSMLSRLGSDPDQPKRQRATAVSRTSSGRTRERRAAPGKSVSVRSLISRSNNVQHSIIDDSADRFSVSESFEMDELSDKGNRGTGALTSGEESAQLAAMMDPATPISCRSSGSSLHQPLGSSRNSKFTGPLKDIYPDDVIVRPQRQNEIIWSQVMDINEHWKTHTAEDSGEMRMHAPRGVICCR